MLTFGDYKIPNLTQPDAVTSGNLPVDFIDNLVFTSFFFVFLGEIRSGCVIFSIMSPSFTV